MFHNAENIANDMDQIVTEFTLCNNLMTEIDPTKLPLDLQIKFAASSVKFAKAVKQYTDELKQIIVMYLQDIT